MGRLVWSAKTRKYYSLRRGFYRYYSYYWDCVSKSFTIGFETANGELSEIEIIGIRKEVFDSRRKELEDGHNSPVSFKFLESNSTAVLKVESFRNDLMEKENIVFKDYVDSCFTQLKQSKTKNLVIDLRDNGGGYSEYGAILYSYLSDTAFEYCKNQIVTTDKLNAKTALPYHCSSNSRSLTMYIMLTRTLRKKWS